MSNIFQSYREWVISESDRSDLVTEENTSIGDHTKAAYALSDKAHKSGKIEDHLAAAEAHHKLAGHHFQNYTRGLPSAKPAAHLEADRLYADRHVRIKDQHHEAVKKIIDDHVKQKFGHHLDKMNQHDHEEANLSGAYKNSK